MCCSTEPENMSSCLSEQTFIHWPQVIEQREEESYQGTSSLSKHQQMNYF